MRNPPEHAIGEALVLLARSWGKQAADAPELSYGLRGRLYASKSGWILLSVPNAMARGAFDALNEPGVELPPDFNAHISVIRPEELAEKGLTPDKITERGHDFGYTLGPVRTVSPHGWDEISKVWFIEVNSPDLEKLRKSYGLTPLPNEGDFKFHITFATRKKNVILDRPYAAKSLIHNPPGKKAAGAEEPSVLDQLRSAKDESDRRNYHKKHHILRELIAKSPSDWWMDSDGHHPGVTHRPTGFRFHLPAAAIPPELLTSAFTNASGDLRAPRL